MKWKRWLLGSRIATSQELSERVSPAQGVAVLGLDAVASAAYGPEALLTVLIGLGPASVRPLLPLTALIVVLLTLVCLSYLQTIGAYPNGGGSFTVARQNLGVRWGLLAAAALGLDYLLNVSVAISAGVAALASAVPAVLPHTLAACLLILAFMTVANLRGVRETGWLLATPTYLFVVCLGGVLIFGMVRAAASHGHPAPVVPPPVQPRTLAAASVPLLLRSFSSGCTAMTGVEAVSNGVPIFREPPPSNARKTLIGIVAILVLLLAGIAVDARAYGVGATPPGRAGYQSVLSQLVAAIAGHGVVYHVTIASIVAVLALSANTSFADFPRLCRLLAEDRFLPAAFAHRGRRLVFTVGILVLSSFAAVLLVAFGGITDALIPLFAVGAFLAFTMSQCGMVLHWARAARERGRRVRLRVKLLLNAVGALGTGATLVVILVSKFAEGAWISVLLIGMAIVGLGVYRRRQLRFERAIQRDAPLDVRPSQSPRVIVLLQRWDQAAAKAMRFALALSPDLEAVQVLTGEEQDLRPRWAELVRDPASRAGRSPPRLAAVTSPYRELFAPILRLVRRASEREPGRPIVVVLPEVVRRTGLLSRFSPVTGLLEALMVMEGGPQVFVVTAPWYLAHRAGRDDERRGAARSEDGADGEAQGGRAADDRDGSEDRR